MWLYLENTLKKLRASFLATKSRTVQYITPIGYGIAGELVLVIVHVILVFGCWGAPSSIIDAVDWS